MKIDRIEKALRVQSGNEPITDPDKPPRDYGNLCHQVFINAARAGRLKRWPYLEDSIDVLFALCDGLQEDDDHSWIVYRGDRQTDENVKGDF